ncbi:uncharacterized protein VTP21DRAFT_1844 [Calcarisporiella thermophila]|uniref:uncharacterized protein n=1 Tax=Calcarisporiella thermophila TaxID=911321 RepID=UPI003742D60A
MSFEKPNPSSSSSSKRDWDAILSASSTTKATSRPSTSLRQPLRSSAGTGDGANLEYTQFSEGSSSHTYPFLHHVHRSIPPHPAALQCASSFSREFNDGSEVADFLSRGTSYTDMIYNLNEDLHTTANRPSRQLVNQFLEGLILQDDIVEYLRGMTYTDDVHQLPEYMQELVGEARNESLQQQEGEMQQQQQQTLGRALQRLNMLRDHLRENVGAKGIAGMQDADLEQVWTLF